ncbi:MAG: DUF1868 domain-containing protein [Candidatus Bruticola sp.]
MVKEDYATYKSRIRKLVEHKACFPAVDEHFCTASSLLMKFKKDGNFNPFYGDTVVFPLSPSAIKLLTELQEQLYNSAGYMLSAQLPPDTFHITLHDLNSGAEPEEVEQGLAANCECMNELLNLVHQKGLIALRTVGIVSMVSSSLVMLFEPVSEADHNLVQKIYSMFDPFKQLSYPLTLHCTLAYYKPGRYKPELWTKLLKVVTNLNAQNHFEVVLDCATLEYQHFSSMKNYGKVDI